jgi:hypothetical protein
MQIVAPAYHAHLRGPEHRSSPEGGYLCCQPEGHPCRAHTALRLRRNAVNVAIGAENAERNSRHVIADVCAVSAFCVRNSHRINTTSSFFTFS